ncbi:hypothetical protein LC605_24455 [Nostoc sp. CHAB 5836]|uniref:hypothetical protein n=1 Tax=Nostoc sp. CHAB 5836 TaxID=2780404 RepID=UPI001E5A41D4|nr:hypothetical protein [Nostoc sp. CHAB 5836]MCC5618178.1 hypothetical protein [Nostoc sp. CHAB 5836]
MTFASNNVVTGQTNFSRYMPVALPGMLSGVGTNQIYPHTNTLSALDTVAITPPATVDNDALYSLTVNGTTISFTTDSSATTAELGAGLYAAIRTDPIIYGLVDATLNTGTGVITLAARTVDLAIAVTTNSANTTNDIVIAKTVTNSKNSVIPFGRFVGRKSTYFRSNSEGVSVATLVDATSGYEVLGVTLSSQATQKVGTFGLAKDGYAFGTVMNVLKNIGTYKGVWVEAVDADLVIGDTPYIAVAAGNEGKITKVSSGNLAAGSNIKIISATEQSFGKYIVLCEVKL